MEPASVEGQARQAEVKPFVLAVIPARGGSVGVPGKNVLQIAGRPVLHYTLSAAADAGLLDDIVVSTDCERIREVTAEFSQRQVAVIDRPEQLSRGDSLIQDALWHAVECYENAHGMQVDIIVWMSANIPHRKPGMVDAVIARHIASGADAAASVSQAKDHPLFLKRATAEGLLQPFLAPEAAFRRQDVEPLYAVDGAVVSISRETLRASVGSFSSHAYLGRRTAYVVQEARYNSELDEQDDIELLEDLIRGAEMRK